MRDVAAGLARPTIRPLGPPAGGSTAMQTSLSGKCTSASRPLAGRRTKQGWFGRIPIAHRGLHDNRAGVPENSLAAFARAAEPGYAVELDVQLLRDGEVVVFHDATWDRLTDRSGPVSGLGADEVRQIRLCDSSHTVPLLIDVLELVCGQVPILIELKEQQEGVGELERAVASRLARYNGPVAVQSFNPYSLKWFRNHMPELPRGQLSGDFRHEPLAYYKKVLLRNLMLNVVSRPAFIAYDIRCLPHWAVARCRRKGLPVVGWTVRNADEAEAAAPFCDNIIFEGFVPQDR